MHHGNTLWFHLTGNSHCIIIVLGTLVMLDIRQKLCQFLVWAVSPKLSPSKMLYLIQSSYLIAKAITKGSNYVARNLKCLAIDMVH